MQPLIQGLMYSTHLNGNAPQILEAKGLGHDEDFEKNESISWKCESTDGATIKFKCIECHLLRGLLIVSWL